MPRFHSLGTSLFRFVHIGMVVLGCLLTAHDLPAQNFRQSTDPPLYPTSSPRAASFAPPLEAYPSRVAEQAFYSTTARPKETLANPQPAAWPAPGIAKPITDAPGVSFHQPEGYDRPTDPYSAQQVPIATNIGPQDPNIGPQDPNVEKTPKVDAVEAGRSDDAMEFDALAQQIEKARTEIEKNETLTPEKKEESLDLLSKASKWLETLQESETTTAQYLADANAAPQTLEQVNRELANPSRQPVPEYPSNVTLIQLEQSLEAAEKSLTAAEEKQIELEEIANSETQANRKAKIAEEKEAIQQQLQEAEASLEATAALDGNSRVPVHQIELEARRLSLVSQLALLDAEKVRIDSLEELSPLERDLAQRRLTEQKKLFESWQDLVTNFRKHEAQRQAEEARQLVDQVPPSLKSLAERNVELAENRIDLANNMETVTADLQLVRNLRKDIDKDFATIQKKVDVVGMTPTVGLLMRNRQDRLPDLQKHKHRIKNSSKKMQQVQVALLELESERSEVGDLDETVAQMLAKSGLLDADIESGRLENLLRTLLEDRRDYLKRLLNDFGDYHDDLSDLALETRVLVKQVDEFENFINEHVLWIRSARPLSMADVSASTTALGSFMKLGIWKDVFSSTGRNVTQHPMTSTLLVVACIVLFVFRRRLVDRLEMLGKRVSEEPNTTIVFTLRSLLVTFVLAAVWPLIFWGIGWWMSMNAEAPLFALSLAHGLKAIASAFFVTELFRQMCRPNGLAEQHFGWNIAWVHVLHRSVGWLMVLTLPVLFLVSVIGAHTDQAWNDSLGRLVSLFGLVVVVAYLHDLLHPWKGGFQVALARTNARWPARFRYLWYALGVGFPLMLGGLVGLGYTYSAGQLMMRFQGMICLVLALVLVRAVLIRTMKVTWNRMSRLRASLEAQRQHMLNPSEDKAEKEKEKEEAEQDVRNIDAQLNQLVRGLVVLAFAVGTWFIWADMFPAFQVLDKVELTSSISLADLIFALLVLIATVAFTKTLPGLLEISILGRLPIDRGARHAIVIISRYLMTLAGVLWACKIIGMNWESVQWLAAAMTVGLAFGLQEIFANMVSGLIILFERPIRIGDMVTVSGVTGKVSKMQIRATTITDLDRRELIVPNKRFITDDVVNWSLSDPISRFIIPVGISYDSDPTEAHRVLLEVADKVPLILKEPAPSAVFVAFGDSTLNLELRSFISSRDNYAPALHATNLAIERAFREANIEIAFPQQDLHIRGASGLFEVTNRDQSEQPIRKAA